MHLIIYLITILDLIQKDWLWPFIDYFNFPMKKGSVKRYYRKKSNDEAKILGFMLVDGH